MIDTKHHRIEFYGGPLDGTSRVRWGEIEGSIGNYRLSIVYENQVLYVWKGLRHPNTWRFHQPERGSVSVIPWFVGLVGIIGIVWGFLS
jgi:hypothetical protein